MKKWAIKIIGILLIPLGIIMLKFGAGNYTKQDPPLSQFANEIAGVCFCFWLPTIILGIFLLVRKKKKKYFEN